MYLVGIGSPPPLDEALSRRPITGTSQDFLGLFSNPKTPTDLETPPILIRYLFFSSFFCRAAFFWKLYVFTPFPYTVCLSGLQARPSRTPKLGVNPANPTPYLFFLLLFLFWSFCCLFSRFLGTTPLFWPSGARPLRKKALLFPSLPDRKTT